MKFKVGDRVKLNKNITRFTYSQAGVSYEEIGTIIDVKEDEYTVNFPSHCSWNGTEEELVLSKYTYEDLKKSPIGTKVIFENGEVFVKDDKEYFENSEAFRDDTDFENLKDNSGCCGKIIKIEEPNYTTVYEYKPEILDEAEKRYLKEVIRPFRDKVTYIRKFVCSTGDAKIDIVVENWYICLPTFPKNQMYKNMEDDKEYTLEELGL